MSEGDCKRFREAIEKALLENDNSLFDRDLEFLKKHENECFACQIFAYGLGHLVDQRKESNNLKPKKGEKVIVIKIPKKR